jgi:hypothetical protein
MHLSRAHISYGHAWNGIPFPQEWNAHSIWNRMVHFIPAGMEGLLFILAGMEWASVRAGMAHTAAVQSKTPHFNPAYSQGLQVLCSLRIRI